MELKIEKSLKAFANKEEHIKIRNKVKIYLERIEQLNYERKTYSMDRGSTELF